MSQRSVVQGARRYQHYRSRLDSAREGSFCERGLSNFTRTPTSYNETALARYGLRTRKFKSYKNHPGAFSSRLGEHDSRFVEGDHKVSFRELPVKFDQSLVGSFIPVLGRTPQLPELLLNALRLIKKEVLVNGTPCAFQSTDNPAVNKVQVRSTLKESKVNRNTHERYWSPRRRRRACLLRRVGAFGCRRRRLRTNLDQRTRIHLKRPFRRVKIATGKKGKPIVRRSRDQSQAKYSPV